MGQQVAHADRPGRLLERGHVLGAAGDQHLSAEFREVLFDRVIHGQLTFVHEDHDASSRDRLGHGGNAEKSIGPHGRGRIEILAADRLQAKDLVMGSHKRYGPGDQLLIHKLLHPRADAGQLGLVRLLGRNPAPNEQAPAQKKQKTAGQPNATCMTRHGKVS